MTTSAVLPHNAKPAATWNAGGQKYDQISETIADAIEHCLLRLAPKSGERVLDVATGTGWTARRLAARGSNVTSRLPNDERLRDASCATSPGGLAASRRAAKRSRMRCR